MTQEEKKIISEKRKKLIKKQRTISNAKLRVIGFFFISFIFFLGGYILYLKTVYGKEYELKAMDTMAKNSNEDLKIEPSRGVILDRYKRSMAISNPVYSVIFDIKKHIENKNSDAKEKTLSTLSEVLLIPREKLDEYIINDPETMYKIVAKEVSKENYEKLNDAKLQNVYYEESSKRYYRNNNLGAQLIGFARKTGNYGLEYQYESILAGIPGRMLRTINDYSSMETKILSPIQGKTLVTTIDLEIQKIAQKAVDIAGATYDPEYASVIVMNPKTGEVLAMAQYPSFNLNFPSDPEYINDIFLKTNWDNFSLEDQGNELNRIWSNFAISNTFEPGSTYKPMVVATALEEGLISETDTFYCGGKKVVGGEEIKCHYLPGHGTQTLSDVLANSCNVGMMDIISIIGPEKYYQYQRDFGFGEKTDIDLPNETSSLSIIYTPAQLKNIVNLATSSMGQGFNATAIQITNAFAATINGGKLMKPYVVSEIVDTNGNIIQNFKPTVVRKVISEDVSDRMRIMLNKVVSPTGTGKKAIIEGYNIGGKTGTAQQGARENKEYTISFIGYLSVENPEIIATAVIHLPKTEQEVQGSTTAAPMLREVLLEIIKYKGIKPSGEVSPEDNINFEKDAFDMPNLVGKSVQEATEKLKNLGLDFELVGSVGNTIKSQTPVEGEKITIDSTAFLYIGGGEEDIASLVKVPNVTDLDYSYAEEILKSNGLNPFMISQTKSANTFEQTTDSPTTYYDAVTTTENSEQVESVTVEPQATDGQSTDGQLATENIPTTTQISTIKIISQSPAPDVYVPKGTYIKVKIE